jgi:geranylgeranyl diphosphate synthase type I
VVIPYFTQKKAQIAEYLSELFAEQALSFGKVNPLGKDVSDRLHAFSLQGKMIRGGLVSLGFSMSRNGQFPKAGPRELVQAGAAMELLQAGLLIHDDIMDRDPIRRGSPTVFYQYAQMADKAGIADAYHVGESLGTCAGDVAYFLAFQVLARLEVSPLILRDIVRLISRELAYVGIAQMQDVYWGAADTPVTDAELMRLYLYKTGRYTFSLPLVVGGLLAEQAEKTRTLLEKIGEYLGTVFQIKDDEIGLFGDPVDVGKPIGSDLREGKKTLFYGYLQRRAAPADLQRLAGIFGNADIDEKDIRFVRELVVQLGIREEIKQTLRKLADKARALISGLPGYKLEDREVMLNLLDYSLVRTR